MSPTTSPLVGFKYTSYDVSLDGSKSISIPEIDWYNISPISETSLSVHTLIPDV